MRALVTGGAGFIGSHLVDALLARGDSVVVLDNFSTGKEANLVAHTRNSRLLIKRGDITDDLTELFTGDPFAAVFHLAAIPRVQYSITNPRATHHVNVTGTLNLLAHCHEANVGRFIFSSSSSIYGDQDTLPLRETMTPNPLSPYALQKLVGEQYCRLYHTLYRLPTISLRYFNVYGPRMDGTGEYACLIPKFAASFLANTPPTINGDGEQTRDFTFVSDVVRVNLAAADTTRADVFGQTINVGAGDKTSVNAVSRTLQQLTKTTVVPAYGPAVVEPRDTQAATDRLQTLLGVRPEVSLEDGLRQTLAALTES